MKILFQAIKNLWMKITGMSVGKKLIFLVVFVLIFLAVFFNGSIFHRVSTEYTLKVEGETELSSEQETITMPKGAVTMRALYEENTYKVVVNNGSGSGEYKAGDTVDIEAEMLMDGKNFSNWSVDKGSLNLSDPGLKKFSFTMPAEDITLTANYLQKKYTLKVTDGRGSGMYSPGDQVKVNAETINTNGLVFNGWTVTEGKLELNGLDLTQSVITFTMPACDLKLKADYVLPETEALAKYHLTVNGGTGSGNYEAGEVVTVHHTDPGEGMTFSHWMIIQGESKSSSSTVDVLSITMPEEDLIITAVFVKQ